MSDQDTPATPTAEPKPGTPREQVDPSTLQPQDEISEKVFELRDEIKAMADSVKAFADNLKNSETAEGEDQGEMIANSIIAFRHLEDAAMRFGKVLQAKNGGVSILSK